MPAYKKIKWRTILGLVLLFLAMWFNYQWMWGVLFLIWVVPDIFSGTTFFIEPIEKRSDPVLYWIIIISWIVLTIYSLLSAFIPELNYY